MCQHTKKGYKEMYNQESLYLVLSSIQTAHSSLGMCLLGQKTPLKIYVGLIVIPCIEGKRLS